MKKLLEVHILQNVAPSLLNRDDTGSPKQAEFGGYLRARLSSQSQKRSVREDFQATLRPEILALRTKRLKEEMEKRLHDRGVQGEDIAAIVDVVFAAIGFMIPAGKDDEPAEKSEYLIFLGSGEIDAVASLCLERIEEVRSTHSGLSPLVTKTDVKKVKEDRRKKVPKELAKAITGKLDGGKAVDLALFGRMLADIPEKNIDGAVHMAHAISTNTVRHEFDYYTAVDDLKPEETQGADMIGTVEFNSGCFYRYAAVDVEQLAKTLGGDLDLAYDGIMAFMRSFIATLPRGKQHTFAAHNPPSFIAVTVAENSQPRNLLNAFVQPVAPRADEDLVGRSIKALDREWQETDRVFGDSGRKTCTVSTRSQAGGYLEKSKKDSLPELLKGVGADLQALLKKGE